MNSVTSYSKNSTKDLSNLNNSFCPNEETQGKFSPVTLEIIFFSNNKSHVFLAVILKKLFFVSLKKIILFAFNA